MISGIIRPFIGASNPVVVAIPGDKIANALLDRGLRPEAGVAHQIVDIGEGLQSRRPAASAAYPLPPSRPNSFSRSATTCSKLFRMVVADIVNPRRAHRPASPSSPGILVDQDAIRRGVTSSI